MGKDKPGNDNIVRANDNDRPWRDNSNSGNGANGYRTACRDTARPVYTGNADDGVCFHGAQSHEASYQQ